MISTDSSNNRSLTLPREALGSGISGISRPPDAGRIACEAKAMRVLASMTAFGSRVALVLTFAATSLSSASAQPYKFEADYRVTLSGVEIGQARLAGNFDGDTYRIDGFGKLTGIAGVFYDYSASGSSAGRLFAGKAIPNAFSANATEGDKLSTVRMTMNANGIRQLKLNPEPTPYWLNHPARVQVTPELTRNTLDPMSALFIAGGKGPGGLDQASCERTVPIYNGRERFDVNLSFRRVQSVPDSQVAGGQVLVCGAKYHAVAGHRTDKEEVQYAEKLDIEVILAPVTGSDLLLPYRVTIPTPLGPAVVQVSDLSATGALTTRAAALISK
jgi:Protein of unknown function (DUF3108)